jgi:multiple sugar transport system substrate-binding protein
MNPQKNITIESIIASGQVPDLIFSSEKDVNILKSLEVPFDQSSLIKKYKVDMNSFLPELNSSQKRLSDKGEILTMPFAVQNFATFYNKDIFDKFGIAYPKDGMSWDELITLARNLSREADGKKYYGLQVGNGSGIARLFDLDFADEKNKKALLDTAGWRKVFEHGKKLYTIPGNLPEKAKFNTVGAMFYKDLNVAMAPFYTDGIINNLDKMLEDGTPMNWDMTTHPSFPEAPGKSHELNMRSIVISKTSKFKDQAFEAAAYIATSPEIQSHLAKKAYGTSMKDDQYKKQFGTDRKVLQGKNVAAIFKTSFIDIHNITKYDDAISKALDQPYYDFVSGLIDENTAIRLAQEAAAKAIAEIK